LIYRNTDSLTSQSGLFTRKLMLNLRYKPALAVLLLLSAIALVSACSSPESSGNNGDFTFSVYTGADVVGGTSISFDELVASEDRPIVLNFWASNCPPCRAEMPALQQAWLDYGDEVLFVGIDIGPYVGLGTYKGGRKLVEDLGVTYPTGNTLNRSVITDWQLTNMPSTFMLASDGRVKDIVIGGISKSRLTLKVEELIAANAG
jgi:thiol-disulfide isomerase/thioredoxin